MKNLSFCRSLVLSVLFVAVARVENASSGPLPVDYQRVAYVEATGTQWVQTDYVPAGDAEYDLAVSFGSLANVQPVFCARSNDATAGRAVLLYDSASPAGLRWDYGVTDAYSAKDRHPDVIAGAVDLISIRQNEVYVNGVKSIISKSVPVSFDKCNALVLFALFSTELGVRPTEATITGKGTVKLFSFTVRESGVVKLDLVPCFRKADAVVGLFDRVSKAFLTPNAALRKGANVSPDCGAEGAVVINQTDALTQEPEANRLANGNGVLSVAADDEVDITAGSWLDAVEGVVRTPIGWTLVSALAGETPTVSRGDGAHDRICPLVPRAGAQYLLKRHLVTSPSPSLFRWPAEGYKRLKSVTTDGSQHLLTDYVPKGNTSIEVELARTAKTTTQAIYCARGTGSGRSFTLFLISGQNLRWDYGAVGSVDASRTLAAPEGLFLFSNVSNTVYVNEEETVLSKPAYSEYTADNRLVLFASYAQASGIEPSDFSNGASISLSVFRVSEGGEPKMCLVPCLRHSDSAVGLYDTIGGVFHVPAGNRLGYEAFDEGPATDAEVDLPSDYTALEYVEASGCQYVLTDYTPRGNACLRMKMSLTALGTQAIFCSRSSTAPQNPYSLFLYNGGLRWDYAEVNAAKLHGMNVGTSTFVSSLANKLYVNGIQSDVSKIGAVDYMAGNRMVLFAAYATDMPGAPAGFSTFASVRLYRFEASENNILKIRLVPCRRKGGNQAVGLYDVVTKTFLEAGGGVLTGGPEQDPNPYWTPDAVAGLKVVGGGLGALGEPTLPYGVTGDVLAGDSFVCAAPGRVKTAEGWAVCRGYLLETNDSANVWHPWKHGGDVSFVYEHPQNASARLTWKWSLNGLLLFMR